MEMLAGSQQYAEALQKMIEQPTSFTPETVTNFTAIQWQPELQTTRALAYEVYNKIFRSDFEANVIEAFLDNLMDGERDPRSIMRAFECVQLIISRIDQFAVLADKIFDAVACYFPIKFKQQSTAVTVKPEDLKLALSKCLVHKIFRMQLSALIKDNLEEAESIDVIVDTMQLVRDSAAYLPQNDVKMVQMVIDTTARHADNQVVDTAASMSLIAYLPAQVDDQCLQLVKKSTLLCESFKMRVLASISTELWQQVVQETIVPRLQQQHDIVQTLKLLLNVLECSQRDAQLPVEIWSVLVRLLASSQGGQLALTTSCLMNLCKQDLAGAQQLADLVGIVWELPNYTTDIVQLAVTLAKRMEVAVVTKWSDLIHCLVSATFAIKYSLLDALAEVCQTCVIMYRWMEKIEQSMYANIQQLRVKCVHIVLQNLSLDEGYKFMADDISREVITAVKECLDGKSNNVSLDLLRLVLQNLPSDTFVQFLTADNICRAPEVVECILKYHCKVHLEHAPAFVAALGKLQEVSATHGRVLGLLFNKYVPSEHLQAAVTYIGDQEQLVGNAIYALTARAAPVGYSLLDEKITNGGVMSVLLIADYLLDTRDAYVNPLWRQRLFMHMMPHSLENAQLLTMLIKSTPREIVEPHHSQIVPVIVKSLSDEAMQLVMLDCLHEILKHNVASVNSCAGDALNQLMPLATISTNVTVKIQAFDCLAAMSQLPHQTLFPYRQRVVRQLMPALDDKWRSVRARAALCRNKWFLMSK